MLLKKTRSFQICQEYFSRIILSSSLNSSSNLARINESLLHELIWDGLSHKGLIARSQGEYKEAISLFTRVCEEAEKAKNLRTYVICLGHLGRTYMLRGEYLKAENKFRECLSITKKLHMSRGVRVQLTNLIEVLIRLTRFDEAEKILHESEERNKEAADKIGIAWNFKHRGQIQRAHGNTKDGDQLIKLGLEQLEQIGNMEYIKEFHDSLHQFTQLTFNMG